MLRIQPITKKLNNSCIMEDLYTSAFPKRQQLPLGHLLERTKHDTVRFNAYYDNDIFVGFSYTITYGDLTYVLYIATRADIRSKGYGSQILNCIKKQYPNNRIVLNLEVQDKTASNSEQRQKRRDFYLKNGYTSAEILMKFLNGDIVEELTLNGTCTEHEFRALHKKYWGIFWFIFFGPRKQKA